MKIVLLGAGNVAFQLSSILIEKQLHIIQIYNRNIEHARQLVQGHIVDCTNNIHEIKQDADIYIMCIADDGIAELASKLSTHLRHKLVVHTSGACSSHLLEPYFDNYGVFYPLQTFTMAFRPDFTKIPILITGNSASSIDTLCFVANKISTKWSIIDDKQRLLYHLSAVIANNFTNHLFAKSFQLLKDHDLSFEMLLPLIEETVRKIHFVDPAIIQTGPAKRGDIHTIQAHLDLISDNPKLVKIYKDISRSINPHLAI